MGRQKSRGAQRPPGIRLALVACVALLAGVAGSVSPVSVPVVAAAGLGAGGEYHELSPARIYDSRPISPVNEPAPGSKPATPSQPSFDINLLGVGGVPASPTDVLAVVVNITVTEPTRDGWLNAFGRDAPAGTASIVNFDTNGVVPNLTIVRPGTDGDLSIKLFTASTTGSAHVVVDVFGWFSTSSYGTNGARLIPVEPGRILDTRTEFNRAPANTPLAGAESLELQIRGAQLKNGVTIPSGPDVVGVVLNVTGVNDLPASVGTFLSVVPELAPGQVPGTSNVNMVRGQIKPNMVIVPVGSDGKVRIYNNSGAAHVVVDVAGYLQTPTDAASRAGRVIPLTSPFRVFDTREAQWGAVSLGAGQTEDWSFADFVNSVNIGGISVGAQSAVIGNFTSASLTGATASASVQSYLTVFPSDEPRPEASNLNTVSGTAPVPNLAILKYSPDKTVRVFNQQGFSHYLYDAAAVVLA